MEAFGTCTPTSRKYTCKKSHYVRHFEIPESSEKYTGKLKTTRAESIHKDLRNAKKNGATIFVKQFMSIDDLKKPIYQTKIENSGKV